MLTSIVAAGSAINASCTLVDTTVIELLTTARRLASEEFPAHRCKIKHHRIYIMRQRKHITSKCQQFCGIMQDNKKSDWE